MRAIAGLALLALGSANSASLHNNAAASRRSLRSGACADLDGSGMVGVTDLLARPRCSPPSACSTSASCTVSNNQQTPELG